MISVKSRITSTLQRVEWISAMWHWHCGADRRWLTGSSYVNSNSNSTIQKTRGWVIGLVCNEHCTASIQRVCSFSAVMGGDSALPTWLWKYLLLHCSWNYWIDSNQFCSSTVGDQVALSSWPRCALGAKSAVYDCRINSLRLSHGTQPASENGRWRSYRRRHCETGAGYSNNAARTITKSRSR